jgi:hypothetical protein
MRDFYCFNVRKFQWEGAYQRRTGTQAEPDGDSCECRIPRPEKFFASSNFSTRPQGRVGRERDERVGTLMTAASWMDMSDFGERAEEGRSRLLT